MNIKYMILRKGDKRILIIGTDYDRLKYFDYDVVISSTSIETFKKSIINRINNNWYVTKSKDNTNASRQICFNCNMQYINILNYLKDE